MRWRRNLTRKIKNNNNKIKTVQQTSGDGISPSSRGGEKSDGCQPSLTSGRAARDSTREWFWVCYYFWSWHARCTTNVFRVLDVGPLWGLDGRTTCSLSGISRFSRRRSHVALDLQPSCWQWRKESALQNDISLATVCSLGSQISRLERETLRSRKEIATRPPPQRAKNLLDTWSNSFLSNLLPCSFRTVSVSNATRNRTQPFCAYATAITKTTWLTRHFAILLTLSLFFRNKVVKVW